MGKTLVSEAAARTTGSAALAEALTDRDGDLAVVETTFELLAQPTASTVKLSAITAKDRFGATMAREYICLCIA
jgi:hypothetical protein